MTDGPTPIARRRFLSQAAALLPATGLTVLASPSEAAGLAPYRLVAHEREVFPDNAPGGYSHFRIPALVGHERGFLYAFCEGRRWRKDHGDTEILLKSSFDGGRTWRHPRCVTVQAGRGRECAAHDLVVGHDAAPSGTGWIPKSANWRNPTAVVAGDRLFLFVTVDEAGEPQRVIQAGRSSHRSRFFVIEARIGPRDGATAFKEPVEIRFGHPYRWGAFGPGRALHHAGRLIVPANTNNGRGGASISFCMISDDLGATWRVSAPAGKATENQITALRDGRLLMSKRMARTQSFWISSNNGETWVSIGEDPALVTPTVQTGLVTDRHGRVVISGPNDEKHRINMSLWVNTGAQVIGGWSRPLSLEPVGQQCRTRERCRNFHGYSCIAERPQGGLVVLHEDSKNGEPYRRLVAAILEER